jgi:NADH-quinone oxidoreductase subunit F
MAGGVPDGRTLQAILLGGAAGSFVGPAALAMPLTFEDARAAEATLGSGVVMLFDDSIDLTDIVKRVARFFREESCGQCVPCRVGTVRQDEALERLAQRVTPDDIALLNDIGRAMRDASICGLGQTAANAIASAAALRVFPTEATT